MLLITVMVRGAGGGCLSDASEHAVCPSATLHGIRALPSIYKTVQSVLSALRGVRCFRPVSSCLLLHTPFMRSLRLAIRTLRSLADLYSAVALRTLDLSLATDVHSFFNPN